MGILARPAILLVPFLFLSLVAGHFCPAQASYLDTFGVDAGGMALGNAMTAAGEGWASVYYNPAALAMSQNIEFSAGFCYAIPDIKATNAAGEQNPLARVPGESGSLDSIAGPSFGFLLPIQRLTPKTLPTPIAMGLGVFVPNLALSTNLIFDQAQPFDVLFQENNDSMVLDWAIATRITPAFYIGVGLASQLHSSREYRISNAGVLQSSDSSLKFGAPSVLAGIIVRPIEPLRLGFVYRQKNEVSTEWSAVAQQTVDGEIVTAFMPETLSLGVSYQITEQVMATAQVDWARWSQYQSPLGTPLENGFSDIFIPRAGVAYRATRKLTFRGGFYYEPTGVTNQLYGFYPVGNDQIVPSVGVGYAWELPGGILSHPLQIDGFFQYHFLLSKDFDRAAPVDPLTQSQDISTSGSIFNLGLSLTFSF